jgi:hypothetical protein
MTRSDENGEALLGQLQAPVSTLASSQEAEQPGSLDSNTDVKVKARDNVAA